MMTMAPTAQMMRFMVFSLFCRATIFKARLYKESRNGLFGSPSLRFTPIFFGSGPPCREAQDTKTPGRRERPGVFETGGRAG